ncbi:squalene synthase HpnC [Noviherbaspirillum aerium]|uniref:squalene synthase HpnC n=1 Tax=Noviherbaspirillum aerium TaxID=2588497 RepID=UPI00124BE083|nr:squalene synthase HpnC [Noviherbaspirillum aerium]
MPVEHYENFPVASLLLPARLRPAVEVIYAFARSADDLADEGDAPASERLVSLEAYDHALHGIAGGTPPAQPLFQSLAKVIADYRLPLAPFHDLISAFKQDVATTRYADVDGLLDYCRRSANPVGTLMLHLYDAADTANLRDSDAICSSLQLINFLQDVAIDWEKQRIYLPLEEMRRFNVSEDHIARANADDAWRALMAFQVGRARGMMLSGAPLAFRLPGRVGWELRLIVQGGLRILERIEANDYDVFRRRPQLGPTDWLAMLWKAGSMKIRLSRMAHVG